MFVVCICCAWLMRRYFPGTKIVRGRSRHPQTTGHVERGYEPFKRALWKQRQLPENKDKSWATLGIYVVARQMNLIYSRHRASHSPQDILFGLTKPTKQDAIVPPQILDVCETEDGL